MLGRVETAISRTALLTGAALLGLLLRPPSAAAQVADTGSAASGSADTGSADTGSANTGPSVMGPTNTLLPRVGIDTTQPGFADRLRDAFSSQTGAGPTLAEAGPGLRIQPQIMVSEEFTQHANQLGGIAGVSGIGGNNGSDFVTLIQPSVLISDFSQRLTGTIHYYPTGEIFAKNGSDDEIRQQLDGNAQITALPGWFYIDLRGSIAEQSVFGGLGQQSQAPLTKDNRETLSSGSATPYLARSLGDLGTVQVGGSYIYSAVAAPKGLNSVTENAFGFAVPNNYGSSWLATKREFANFTTGDIVERLQNEISVDASQYAGSGESAGSHRLLVADDASFAINRLVAVVGQIGYENVDYPQSLYRYDGGIYAAGFTLTPSKDTNLTLEYRRTDGFGAIFGHGAWQITPRIRATGTYSEGISTFNQDQQNNLLYGNTDATGANASALLAAPLIPTSDLSPNNQSLQHQRQLNLSVAYVADRDIVTLQYNQSRGNVIGSPLGIPQSLLARYGLQNETLAQLLQLPPFLLYYIGITPSLLRSAETFTSGTSQLYSGSVTWRHDLQPTLSSDLSLGYNRSTDAFTAIQNTGAVQVGAGLTKDLSDTLSGNIHYAGTFQIGGSQLDNAYQDNNTFTISVTKKF